MSGGEKYIAVVRETAARMGMLDESGKLKTLDSLQAGELLIALEDATGLIIPTTNFKQEYHASVESLAELLATVS